MSLHSAEMGNASTPHDGMSLEGVNSILKIQLDTNRALREALESKQKQIDALAKWQMSNTAAMALLGISFLIHLIGGLV
jgi:hypothetical protein